MLWMGEWGDTRVMGLSLTFTISSILCPGRALGRWVVGEKWGSECQPLWVTTRVTWICVEPLTLPLDDSFDTCRVQLH